MKHSRSGWLIVLLVLVVCAIPFLLLYFFTTGIANGVLPDVMGGVKLDGGTERINNAKDEYSELQRRYGNPNSILSTENDKGTDKPLVASRITRYDEANVKIILVPIGCVSAFIKAAQIVSHPGSSREDLEQLRAHPCTLSPSGWTIMGYEDLSNTPISAESASVRLSNIKDKRILAPVEDQDGKSVPGQT